MATALLPAEAGESFRKDFAFLKYREALPSDTDTHVRVKGNAFWSYCGPLIDPNSAGATASPDSVLPSNFHEFAAKTFTGPVIPSLVPFLTFIKALLTDKGLHHYLLTVRASTPTHEFDRARWHSDELFFAESADGSLPGTRIGLKMRKKEKQSDDPGTASGTNWKICTTLLGPSTLFIPTEHQESARRTQESARQAASTDHDCLSIRCVGCTAAADSVRLELDSTLAQYGVVTAMPGECSVFKVGRQCGAIHSEPCMSESTHGRIFVNVVPGTEKELRTLLGKWGMEFPRQWWIGSN